MRYRHAASPKATPRANVVRPEATLPHRPSAASSAGASGRRGTTRRTSTAAIQVAARPDATVSARTPTAAIKYGDIRL
ncbi:hypothetical protein RKD47_004518 [Streptomyces albogriseolus]